MAYRKCKQCSTKFAPEVGIISDLYAFCSEECRREFGIKNASKLANKAKKKRVKETKSWIREKKKSFKSITQHNSEAQTSINAFVRIRDIGKPCPSCDLSIEEIESTQGWKSGGAWDAGHFRSRGAASQLRYNLYNIHRQCKSCNAGAGKYEHKRETTQQKYEVYLRNLIGDDRVEQLLNNNETRVYTVEYCERIKKIFRKRTRLYKKLFR